MKKVEYRQFISELEFIGKDKSFSGLTNKIFKSISFKENKDILKDKKSAYDFMIANLFAKYGIENDELYDRLDEIWEKCDGINSKALGRLGVSKNKLKYLEGIQNTQRLVMGPLMMTPSKLIDLQLIMKEYIKLTYDYCSAYAKEQIHE